MNEFQVIVVPYELGRLRQGVGRAPERLLAAGAEGSLAQSNAQVRRDVVELDPSFDGAAGRVAGLAEPTPAVVWLDAYADFNSPETSLEGYFDGMGLTVLTGGADRLRSAFDSEQCAPPIAVGLLRGTSESLGNPRWSRGRCSGVLTRG